MEVALSRTAAGRPGVIASPSFRRVTLVALVFVIVVCLGVVGWVVGTRSAGDGLGDRLSSLQENEVPGTSASETREQLLSLSREFVTRFTTYGPDQLDDSGQLSEYGEVSELMTPKFAGVFTEFVELAEQSVIQFGASSVGTVTAVGVASQDEDSAELLVAGTVQLGATYERAGDGNGNADDDTDDDQSGDDRFHVTDAPRTARYEVSLVKIDGTWLVDDLDDVDDGQPSFSQPAIPEEPSGDSPTEEPTTEPTSEPTTEPTSEPTSEPTRKGKR